MRTTGLITALLLATACSGEPTAPTDPGDTDVETPFVDADDDGVPAEEDCDDYDFEVYPGAEEYCDGKDNDCDDEIDEDAVNAEIFYADEDRDGFGDDEAEILACEAPPRSAEVGGDCDDTDALIHPNATEVCDDADVDEDCDGVADDLDDSTDPETMRSFYADADGDGFGDSRTTVMACDPGPGRTLDFTDCDDADADANPDLGCPVDWDGEWSVEATLTVSIPEERVKDSCTVELEVTVDSSARESVRTTGRGVCLMKAIGLKSEVWLDGRFASDDRIEGTLWAGKDSVDVDLRLSPDPARMSASGTDATIFLGMKATVDHEIDGSKR